MELIHLGKKLNPDMEYELFPDKPFGFKVEIKLDKENPINKFYTEFELEYRNVSEVHWKYEPLIKLNTEEQVAIESNYHGTGCTRYIEGISKLEIFYETEYHPKF